MKVEYIRVILIILSMVSWGFILYSLFRLIRISNDLTNLKRINLSIIGLIVVLGVFVTYPKTTGPEIFAISDSLEYTSCAISMINNGTCSLTLNDRSFPSRYSPWFSIVTLTPYIVLSGNLNYFFIPIIIFAVIGVVSVYFITQLLAVGVSGGLLAVLAALLLPSYRFFASIPMTDIPCTALVLLSIWQILIIRKEEKNLFIISLGILIALATSFRPLTIFLLIPLFYKIGFRALLALVPLVILAISTFIYNLSNFNSINRTGYNFWTAVPYNSFRLTFSLKYVIGNLNYLITLLFLSILLLYITVILLREKIDFSEIKNFYIIIGLFSLPLIVVHLCYFFGSDRFYLPITVLLCCGIGAGCEKLIFKGGFFKTSIVLTILSLFFIAIIKKYEPSKLFLNQEKLSDKMCFVGGYNPLLVQMFVIRDTNRKYIPVSRQVEYASKFYTPFKIDNIDSITSDPFAHRISELKKYGAKDVYHTTYEENQNIIKKCPEYCFITESILKVDRKKLAKKIDIKKLNCNL
jgi:hypothetical protein